MLNYPLNNFFIKTILRASQLATIAVAACLVFLLVFSGPALADPFQMQSGYFVGDATDDRAITGLGFAPNLVLIKDDTANGASGILFKSSTMAGENTIALAETDATYATNVIQSLDADGFTIGSSAEVNASNLIQHWVAFGGSDCSASGTFCVGQYTGTGSSLEINVGFQPDLVVVKRDGANLGVWRSSAMTGTVSNYFSATAELASGGIESLGPTGFTVTTDAVVNTNAGSYHYFAFKEGSGSMDVGTYTGNGADNRNITTTEDPGLTFHPNFVLIKRSTAVNAVGSLREHYGDRSIIFNDAASAADHIQGLRSAGGFQVGASTSVNTNLGVFYYAAFGGAATKAAGTGSFSMTMGTYTGTGSSLGISGLGFAPDVVVIKNDAVAQQSVFRTKLMAGDRTAFLANGATVFTLGITSLDSDGFTVGTSGTVNTSTNTYYWTAYGNALKPDRSGGASDFLIGQYIGTGDDNTDVDRLPLTPALVTVKHVGTSVGAWRTANQTGDQTLFFSASALAANLIQTLNSDGFQKGTNASVNTSGNTYDYFAFAAGSRFTTGTYTGSGGSQSITASGYRPNHLWIKKTTGGTARGGVLRTSTQTGNAAQPFLAAATINNAITALLTNGFTVNTAVETNENTFSYQYAIWQELPLAQANYRFFANTDSTNVGTALAAQSTPATLTNTGDPFRLRSLVRADSGNLLTSGVNFKLQFVDRGVGTCAAPSGGTPADYTDVTAATTIAFNNNATPTDGAALTTNASDPTDGARGIVAQTYEEANTFTNLLAAINDGTDGLWDFSLVDNGATQVGNYCLRIVRSDGALLDSYLNRPEVTMAPDIIAPDVSLSSTATSPTNTAPIPITIQFSENVTGFEVGDITVGNGSAGNFAAVDGDTYTADITPTTDGVVTVDIAIGVAIDVGANGNTAATQFSITYDTTVPDVTISSSETDPTKNSPIPITVQFSEDVTGFVIGDLTVGNGTASNFLAVDGDTYTLDVTPSGQGAVTVDVASAVAQDDAGNSNSSASQFSITYDTVAPTVNITSSDADPTSISPIPIEIQFSEVVTGFDIGDLTVGNGTAGNFNAVDGDTYTADITPTTEGIVTVDISGSVAQDLATNNNTAASQFSIEYDTTALTVIVSSALADPTNTSPIPITIEFNGVVTGFEVSEIVVGNGSAGSFVDVDGDTYTADITPTTDGAVTVDIPAAVAQDGSLDDNLASAQFSITYDTTEPALTISSNLTSPTNTSPIPVTFQFDETVTGFAIGDISVGNGTLDNFIEVDGDTYSADITPTSQGAITVNVAGSIAQDIATNNNTAASQFSITYDPVGPNVTITSTESSPTSVSPIPITIQFDENVTGFVIGEITVGNGSAGNFVAVDGDTYTAGITPSGTATITVDVAGAVAQDAANNGNTAATQFSIDYQTPPTIFKMQSGYYVGDGVDNRAITGLGFAPNLVLIKDDTANGASGILIKSSTMAGENTIALAEIDATYTTNVIQSLDSDGFTIGNSAEINVSNLIQHWVAFGNSDCSENGTFCVGQYTGTGSSLGINIGFQPDLVIVKRDGANLGIWRSAAMAGTVSNYFSATAELASGGIESLNATGFTVGTNAVANANAGSYHYFAFKQVADVMDIGTYSGNGADNRNITSANDAGLTFHPNFVFVKRTTAVNAVGSLREHYGDRSIVFDDVASAVDHIQGLLSGGGFQIGASTSVNTNSGIFYYAAFGGATAKAAGSNSFNIQTGTYTGTGASQPITGLGFAPDVVVIKNNAAQQSVFRTSLMAGDRTAFLANGATVFTLGITSLDGDGFTVGTNATVNTSANAYYWTAYGNAIRPDRSGGAYDFLVGQYIGTGNDNTDVDRLPLSPALVAVKHVGTSVGAWRTLNQSGDLTLFFSAAAQAADVIQTLNSDGFQKGTSGSVNTSGNTYDYFAFASGARFATGSYTGTGSSQSITSLSYTPDNIWIKKTTGGTARGGVLRTSAQAGDAAQPFLATATLANAITAILTNGFTVNTAVETNENTFTYQYATWDAKRYAQAGYRFFANSDSTNVGSALAADSTPANLSTANDSFRLRSLLRVDNGNLLLNGREFRLQYAGKGTGTCASPVGGIPASYTEVTAATVISFNDNPTPTDGLALTTNVNDPIDGARPIVAQTYEEANTLINSQAAVNNASDGLWDLSLIDQGAASATTYCLRVVKSNNSLLDNYLSIAEITVPADNLQPSVTITSTASNPTGISPIPITIQFSENAFGFVVGDIVVGNGSAGNFVAVDGNTYTASITPVTGGVVTVDIPQDVAQDLVGNNNTAATQFSILFVNKRRVILSTTD